MDGYCPRCYTKRDFMEDALRDLQTLGLASLIDGWRNACEGRGNPDECRKCGQEYDWDDPAFKKG